MGLSDTLTAHADAFRQKTGVSSKLTIADMTRLLGDLSWSKTNLLKGTSNQYRKFTSPAPNKWFLASTSSNNQMALNKLNSYTYSAVVSNLGKVNIWGEIYFNDPSGERIHEDTNFGSARVYPGEKDKLITVTRQIPEDAAVAHLDICGFTSDTCVFLVKNERLYAGTEPGVWTPNPADKVG